MFTKQDNFPRGVGLALWSACSHVREIKSLGIQCLSVIKALFSESRIQGQNHYRSLWFCNPWPSSMGGYTSAPRGKQKTGAPPSGSPEPRAAKLCFLFPSLPVPQRSLWAGTPCPHPSEGLEQLLSTPNQQPPAATQTPL